MKMFFNNIYKMEIWLKSFHSYQYHFADINRFFSIFGFQVIRD